MKVLFKNAKVLDLKREQGYFCGCVAVDGNTISYVGTKEPAGEFNRIIDAKGNLLMPGFVNAHAHTPMTLLRGVKDDSSLHEWLFDGVLPLEANMTNDDIYWGQMLGMAEYARNGITCFEECYFGYEGICKAVAKAGYRARIGIGPVVQTSNDYDCYEDITNIYNIIKRQGKTLPFNYMVSLYPYPNCKSKSTQLRHRHEASIRRSFLMVVHH